MTQKMMRLFNTVTEAVTYVKNELSISSAKAKVYVTNNTANKVDDKVWVILP
jgi:hypothetical protein